MYQREIPRDLFNEAKLLKCMGQLALHIHDGNYPSLRLEHQDDEGDGFKIDQDSATGNLFCCNLVLMLNDEAVSLGTTYNSKSPYPLMFMIDDVEGYVFNDDGSFHEDFKAISNHGPI